MAKILIHVTCGPENPTRAALGFLIGKAALEESHTVTMVLAGDAVALLRDAVLDSLAGLGTGKLRDHYDALVKGGAQFYMSGPSSAARGVTEADLAGKPAKFGTPHLLVQLALDHDRMFVY